MPVAAYLIPAVAHPVIAVALTDPAAGNPDVRTVSPLPIARRPDIACTRRGNDLDARRRGRHVNIDADRTGRHAAGCSNVQTGDKYG
jgi:hypothetical protein